MIQRDLPSFRTRLRLILVAFVAAMTIALSLFVDSVATKILWSSGERQLVQAAAHLAERLDEDLADPLRDIMLSANAYEVRAAVAGGDPAAARRWIDHLKPQLPAYAWIGVTDKTGRVLAASDGVLTGADVSKRPWFSEGQAGPAVLDVHEALLLQKYLAPDQPEPLRFVDVAAPVSGLDGAFGGVIAAHLSWSWAEALQRSILRSISHIDRVEVLVLSRSGEVLVGPRDLIGTSFGPKADERFVSARAETHGLGVHPGLGWSVVARQPVEAAFAAARTFRVVAIAGVVLISLAFSILAGRIAKGVARPFEALTRQVDALRTHPEEPLSAHAASFREDAKLAASLTQCAATLQERDADLRRLNATLEGRVEERTRALNLAKDEAEAATEAKTEFLATMSHEIRSPLGSIVGLTDLLLDDERIEGLHRHRLSLIQAASAGLKLLVNDILDLSKIEASGFQIVERPFRLDHLVGTCVSLSKAQADPKGVTVSLKLDPSLAPVIVADEHRIRQVLTNLLGNAVKFTRSGSIQLLVRASDPPDRIHWAVIDTGIGIARAKIDTLFKPYVQADASIQHEFGGTGLGLAISQRLVNLMGGEISVTSEEGHGSTFAFSLPLRVGALPVDSGADAIVPAARPLGILLADDLGANREIASAMLERVGHSVHCVEDGRAALRAAEERRFDVILLDIQMPGLDGDAVAVALRNGEGPNVATPIVALTANVLSHQIARFRAAGMDAHVAKPLVRSELIGTIESLFAARAPEPAPAIRPVPSDTFSPPAFDDVLSILGAARTEEYLGDLAVRITRPWQDAVARERLAETAHKIVGLAGMLGFVGLAEECRSLEDACEGDADIGGILANVNDASASALVTIARLMAECRTAWSSGTTVEQRELKAG